jgi:hypothetical protein
MKKTLRILALTLVIGSIVFWAATGMNRGWTKNQVQIETPDEVTGLKKIDWQDKFVPGVDFLGKTFLGATILTGVSLLFRTKSK